MTARWLCWVVEAGRGPRDGRVVSASDAEGAAESFLDQYDADCAYELDFPVRVAAQPVEGDRKVRVLDVEREYSPSYDARDAKLCYVDGCRALEIPGAGECRRHYRERVRDHALAMMGGRDR